MRAESAGTSPARAVWPEVVEVMAEVGIDLAGRKPQKLLREVQLHADWAVTMGCGDACPYVPTTVEQDHDAEEIRACADAILGRYDDVPVRSFVQPLALRQTRDCLHREHCDALLAS